MWKQILSAFVASNVAAIQLEYLYDCDDEIVNKYDDNSCYTLLDYGRCDRDGDGPDDWGTREWMAINCVRACKECK